MCSNDPAFDPDLKVHEYTYGHPAQQFDYHVYGQGYPYAMHAYQPQLHHDGVPLLNPDLFGKCIKIYLDSMGTLIFSAISSLTLYSSGEYIFVEMNNVQRDQSLFPKSYNGFLIDLQGYEAMGTPL
jgi:hypothetical protein